MSPKSINDFLIRMFVTFFLFIVTAHAHCVSQKNETSLENKLVISPLIFSGKLLTKSSIDDSISIRVFRVYKGTLSKRLGRQIRLQFAKKRKKAFRQSCGEERLFFNPKSSRKKYLFFVASRPELGPGMYKAMFKPIVLHRKKVKRAIRRVLCKNCLKKPFVKGISYNSAKIYRPGDSLKLKCLLPSPGVPKAVLKWTFNASTSSLVDLRSSFHVSIRHKRKRSILRIPRLNPSDSGTYSCIALNALGSSSASSEVKVVQDGKKDKNYQFPAHEASKCPIASFCLNQGTCFFYEMIGELVCKCKEGFAGQRCQFKKAKITLPFGENETSCGLYSHDYHLREICAVWRSSPSPTEMTTEEYREWKRVEQEIQRIKKDNLKQQIYKFKYPKKQN